MYGTKEVCQTKEEVTSFIEKLEEKHADGSAASVFVCVCVRRTVTVLGSVLGPVLVWCPNLKVLTVC